MSLLGLSLAIGVLIDDAIVVRENIVRHMRRGEDRRTAALKGTAEIGMAVMATTFSIVAVFAPVAFIPGITGECFLPFGLTVVASVIVSLFISFTLDPMLSAYWGDPVDLHNAPRKGIGRVLQRFTTGSTTRPTGTGASSRGPAGHRWRMFAAALAVAAILLQGAFGGSDFLPKSDSGTLAVDIRMPPSSSFAAHGARRGDGAGASPGDGATRDPFINANSRGHQPDVDIGKSTQTASAAPAEMRQRPCASGGTPAAPSTRMLEAT